MTVTKINPEAVVFEQLDGQLENIVAALVWKLARDGIRITSQDLERFQAEIDAGKAVLYTHGHKDSIEFSIVTASAAVELAKWDAKQSGSGGN